MRRDRWFTARSWDGGDRLIGRLGKKLVSELDLAGRFDGFRRVLETYFTKLFGSPWKGRLPGSPSPLPMLLQWQRGDCPCWIPQKRRLVSSPLCLFLDFDRGSFVGHCRVHEERGSEEAERRKSRRRSGGGVSWCHGEVTAAAIAAGPTRMSDRAYRVESTTRLAQWRIDSLSTFSYRRSDLFKLGLWNWYQNLHFFPHLSR